MVAQMPWTDLKDLFLGLPDALRKYIEIAQMVPTARRVRRKEFYAQRIAPIHDQMVTINADYTASFVELIQLLDDKTDFPAIVAHLEKNRLIYLYQRKWVSAWVATVREIPPKVMKRKDVVLLLQWQWAIEDFMRSGSPGEKSVSWYADFISSFRSHVQRGHDPYGMYEGIVTTRPPAAIARDAVYRAVHFEMPEDWQKYIAAHSKLELLLNR